MMNVSTTRKYESLDAAREKELLRGIALRIPKTVLAEQFGIDRKTVYNILKRQSQREKGSANANPEPKQSSVTTESQPRQV